MTKKTERTPAQIETLLASAEEIMKPTSGEWRLIATWSDRARFDFVSVDCAECFHIFIPRDPQYAAVLQQQDPWTKVIAVLCDCARCKGGRVKHRAKRFDLDPPPRWTRFKNGLPSLSPTSQRSPARVAELLEAARKLLAPEQAGTEWRERDRDQWPHVETGAQYGLFGGSKARKPIGTLEIFDDLHHTVDLVRDRDDVYSVCLAGRGDTDPRTHCLYCGRALIRRESHQDISDLDRDRGYRHNAAPYEFEDSDPSDEPDAPYPWRHVERGPIDWDEEDRKLAAQHRKAAS